MNQEYFEKCEQFLLGNMSDADRKKFEDELRQNEELQMELELTKAIMGSAALSAKEKMKNELEEIHLKNFDQEAVTASQKKSFGKWALGLALIILIGMALVLFKFMSPKEEPRIIFAQHYLPAEIEFTHRGTEQTTFMRSLHSSYERKDFKRFLELMNDRDSLLVNEPRLSLAYGISLLEMNDVENAIKTFKRLSENPIYKDQASWYLALAYLKSNDVANSKQTFSLIKDSSSKYGQEASQILNQLKD